MVAVNRTPKLKVFYPAPEEFECHNLTDILSANPRVRCTRLAISSIRRNRYDHGQARVRRGSFLERAGVIATAIKSSGELDAILVGRHAEGYWVCLDGHHRLEACKILGMTRIPAVTLEP
jgi:hypothetical protein